MSHTPFFGLQDEQVIAKAHQVILLVVYCKHCVNLENLRIIWVGQDYFSCDSSFNVIECSLMDLIIAQISTHLHTVCRM